MSKFFVSKFDTLEPYVPGEQPQDMSYVKLNTNESPFDPPKEVVPVIRDAARNIRLYSDPESRSCARPSPTITASSPRTSWPPTAPMKR